MVSPVSLARVCASVCVAGSLMLSVIGSSSVDQILPFCIVPENPPGGQEKGREQTAFQNAESTRSSAEGKRQAYARRRPSSLSWPPLLEVFGCSGCSGLGCFGFITLIVAVSPPYGRKLRSQSSNVVWKVGRVYKPIGPLLGVFPPFAAATGCKRP